MRKAAHEIGLRMRVHTAIGVRASQPSGPYFRANPGKQSLPTHPAWLTEWWAYGQPIPGTGPNIPNWHGPLGKPTSDCQFGHWRDTPAPPPGVDIKDTWEFSRFDWAVCMAQRIACGDGSESARLHAWLDDWVGHNPPFRGPNWQCGQEASLRVLHLALTGLILDEIDEPEEGLLDLVEVHLRRITATTSYARCQQNNHLSSEATALFIGGSWLARAGRTDGQRFESKGRQLLQAAANECVCDDGTFSQYSATYQRLFLDTCSLAELWRKRYFLPPFCNDFASRVRSCVAWLDSIVDPVSGDAPNIGGNDGAMLLPVGLSRYRDFRPSLQLASAIFSKPVSCGLDEASRCLLDWLGVAPTAAHGPPTDQCFPDGGFIVARGPVSHIVFRLPVFRFRPAHADGLHIDLWVRGVNVLRDSGSQRYSGAGADAWFSSTAAHCTVELDGRSQMPRLGKFLFGAWLQPSDLTFSPSGPGSGEASACYRDAWGGQHRRHIRWSPSRLVVTDAVSGFKDQAVLRWHLGPKVWSVNGDKAVTDGVKLSIAQGGRAMPLTIGTSPRSLYYGHSDTTPMIECRANGAGQFVTTVEWTP
jgi:hypothetical protein